MMLFADTEISWLEKLFNYGVPTVLLALVCYAGWRGMRWLHEKVADPLIEVFKKIIASHLKLINTLNEHIPKQTDMLTETKDEVVKQTAILQEGTEKFAIIENKEDEIIAEVKKCNKPQA